MFQPPDPNFRERVRASFARQQVMATLGIEMVHLEPGEVHLTMLPDPAYTQQHGFMHAGIITTALDSACGYAAFTLMPPDAAVLTVEFKTNLLAPAKGDRFVFRGPGHQARPNADHLRSPRVGAGGIEREAHRDDDGHTDGRHRAAGHRALTGR